MKVEAKGGCGHDGAPGAQNLKFTPSAHELDRRDPRSPGACLLLPAAVGDRAERVGRAEKLANRYSALNVQCSVQAYSQPAPAVQPARNFEPVPSPAPGRRRRGVDIGLACSSLGEGDAAGEVGEIAVRRDADARAQRWPGSRCVSDCVTVNGVTASLSVSVLLLNFGLLRK